MHFKLIINIIKKKNQKTNIICHVSVIKVMYPSVYDFICCKNHIQLKKKIERRKKKIEYSIWINLINSKRKKIYYLLIHIQIKIELIHFFEAEIYLIMIFLISTLSCKHIRKKNFFVNYLQVKLNYFSNFVFI